MAKENHTDHRLIKRNQITSKIKYWFSFPHVLIFIIIVVLTIIVLAAAIFVKNIFWSSIFSNIFAGLLTGLVLFLLSAVRQVYIAQLEEKLRWMKGIEKILLEYLPLHNRLIHDKPNEEERFDRFYDILCKGNEALEYIRWNSINNKLGFVPSVYCKNEFDISVAEMTKHSQELHEKLRGDFLPENDRDAWKWFECFDRDIHDLYNAVRHGIESYESRLAAINRSII